MFAFLQAHRSSLLLGFLLIALFIWFAGPYFAFADYRPLESVSARLIAIGVVVALWAARPAVQAAARLPRERSAGGGGRRAAAAGAGAPSRPKSCKLRERFEEAVADAQAAAPQRPQPLRPAVVRHHRRARLRQDDGAAQLRAEVSARAARRQGSAARRRRHAQLRLVVHRRSRLPRHRRPLHDAGLGRRVRQRRLERSSWRCCASTARAGRSTASSSRSARRTC